MAVINSMTFFSKELARPVHFCAVFSNDCQWGVDTNPHFKRPAKNVYLLHGYSGCDSDWLYGAPLQEFANRFNVNFFLPNGDNSFYLDQPETGYKYLQFVGKEFVEYTHKTFNVSDKREDNMIGGLSMGGFGTIHTALSFPGTFSKAIALSSALIVNGLKFMSRDKEDFMANYDYYEHTFGGDLSIAAETDINPEILAKKLMDSGRITEWPLLSPVAAVSVGIVNGEPLLDLCYTEDSAAEVDMNVIMNAQGRFVELQGTGEEATFSEEELATLLKLARKGLTEIFAAQQAALKS